MTLTFNPLTHEYRLDGRHLPSVTQILTPLYDFSRVDPGTLQAAAEFGKQVHAALALWDHEELDTDDLDTPLISYLDAWRKFLRETGFEVSDIEREVAFPKYGYAGRLDRIGWIKYKNQICRVVIDIKTGATINPVVGIQLAAYQAAYNSDLPGICTKEKITHRASVRVSQSGKYNLDWWEDKGDWNTFLALLQITNWRLAHFPNK